MEGISDEHIEKLSMPNGIPLVYYLDDELNPIRQGDGELLSGRFLGDHAKVKAADWMLTVAKPDELPTA